jgi:hypothetical protein
MERAPLSGSSGEGDGPDEAATHGDASRGATCTSGATVGSGRWKPDRAGQGADRGGRRAAVSGKPWPWPSGGATSVETSGETCRSHTGRAHGKARSKAETPR